MRSQAYRHLGGYTLFGVVMYIALTSALLVALSILSILLSSMNARATVEQELVYATQFAHAQLRQVVSGADTVLSPADGLQGAFVEIETGDVLNDPVRIYVENGVLMQQMAMADSVALTPTTVSVDSFTVTHTNAATSSIIRTEIVLQATDPGPGSQHSMYATTVMAVHTRAYVP